MDRKGAQRAQPCAAELLADSVSRRESNVFHWAVIDSSQTVATQMTLI